MKKSSVYLPDALKAELADLARRWGRSEAELIRDAIERLVQSSTDAAGPSRCPVAITGPRFVGVGVGPGDPTLITERALDVLRAADTVIAPSSGRESISRSEAVVRSAAPELTVGRLVIEIGDDEAARRASLEAGAVEVIERLDRGEVVAMAVLGDPSVYSVFTRLRRAVLAHRPTIAVDCVPGIMGFQELAARTGTVLVEGDEELSVVALGVSADAVGPLLADDHRTVVVYKGGRHLPVVAKLVEEHDRTDGTVVGELLGLPGGRATPLAEVADRPSSYLATVVSPARRTEQPG
jgi:precorrin-2/cobalt-factor-2 C20-methyltransferase